MLILIILIAIYINIIIQENKITLYEELDSFFR